MILLLTGTDDFRIRERLKDLRRDYDSLSISVFQDNLNFEKIRQESATVSFFTVKKLVIIYNAAKMKEVTFQKKMIDWLSTPDEKLEIIFVEEELRLKNWLHLVISKKGRIETYNLFKPHEVTRWIQDRVRGKEGQIDIIAAEKLTQMLGNDLWRISGEIDKLLAYDKKITPHNIDKLVEPEFLDSIFSLMDAISEKKEKKALTILNNFLKEEGNEQYLIAMIARQIRNLISVKDLSERGKTENEIASKLKLHPYVVKNTLRQSRYITMKQLLSFHHALLEADLEIKSNTDSKVTLFRLVHTFCST